MKRLFVLMSCAVSLNAFAASEPVKPKAIWVPSSTAPARAAAPVQVQQVPAPVRAQAPAVQVQQAPAPVRAQAQAPAVQVQAPVRAQAPAPVNSATVVQVPAGSNVKVVTAPAASPVTMYQPPADTVLVQGERPAAERMPFRAGVSTVTVEKMAQALGCVGGQGAGLMTPQGPVEVYRMVCESGQVYMARCELRQCRTVSDTPPGGYAAVTASAANAMRQVTRRNEVPGLSVDWRCGACVRNDALTAALKRAYAAEARKNGMFVSEAATANVSITQYAKHMFPRRNNLAMQAVYGQTAVNLQETTAAFGGMDALVATSAQKLFKEMRGRTY